MEQVRDICSGCGLLTLIQNKTHWLCPECVFKKNHGGKTKEEVYRERHEKKQEGKKIIVKQPDVIDKPKLVESLKKAFSIKKISNKKAEINKKLHKVYKVIDQSREQICEGCGKPLPLSHSHLLSQKNREDLICDEENIRLHCFGNYHSCHDKWERGIPSEVATMLDFKENLEYIKTVDIKIYNKIVAKFEFYKVKLPI